MSVTRTEDFVYVCPKLVICLVATNGVGSIQSSLRCWSNVVVITTLRKFIALGLPDVVTEEFTRKVATTSFLLPVPNPVYPKFVNDAAVPSSVGGVVVLCG